MDTPGSAIFHYDHLIGGFNVFEMKAYVHLHLHVLYLTGKEEDPGECSDHA